MIRFRRTSRFVRAGGCACECGWWACGGGDVDCSVMNGGGDPCRAIVMADGVNTLSRWWLCVDSEA